MSLVTSAATKLWQASAATGMDSIGGLEAGIVFDALPSHSLRVNEDISTEPPTSGAAQPSASPPMFRIVEFGKEKEGPRWLLTLHPGHLALNEQPEEPPYIFPRAEMMKSVMFVEAMKALTVEKPRKIMFRLAAQDAQTLSEWIGKPFLAMFYLKRRVGIVLPWGILIVLAGLLSLVPTAGGAGTQGVNLITLSQGMVLVGAWVMAKTRPSPFLFLVDSAWFAWVGISLGIRVFVNDHSKFWLLLVALLLYGAVTGVRHFLRFRGVNLKAVATR